jgi:predicted PhzF superfamily epimerase YddE/YHI9
VKLTFFQRDAFTTEPFCGNPAGIVPLESWLDDRTMQSIAAEANLAETAFIVREPDGWRIRWFTPTVEMDLCGHATLASAHVAFERLVPDAPSITFASRSGPLTVTREGDKLSLDFPARPARRCDPPAGLVEGLGASPAETWIAADVLAVFADEQQVRALAPRMALLRELPVRGVIATAPGSDADFVSRFFAPAVGVDEDPVTGSTHTTLIPYWSQRLGKKQLRARQLSARGGELWCEDRGDRVRIAGHVVSYLEGTISV